MDEMKGAIREEHEKMEMQLLFFARLLSFAVVLCN